MGLWRITSPPHLPIAVAMGPSLSPRWAERENRIAAAHCRRTRPAGGCAPCNPHARNRPRFPGAVFRDRLAMGKRGKRRHSSLSWHRVERRGARGGKSAICVKGNRTSWHPKRQASLALPSAMRGRCSISPTRAGRSTRSRPTCASVADMLAASADLRRVIRSPVIDRGAQGKAIAALADQAQLSHLTRNFLGLLARNRRLFALPEMIDALPQSSRRAPRRGHGASRRRRAADRGAVGRR